ncbi:MAG: hypothetical protein Q4P29_01710 [Tissierellia bacterium]|nr:hypothetical protein [Tissierellia bacterium]
MKNLESYRKELNKRILVLVIFCAVALLAVSIGNFYLNKQFPNKTNVTDFVIGFFCGIELVCIFYMGFLFRALKNEKILKKMYLKENDEREILIRMKSGASIIPYLSIIIAIASLIVAYISYEAFIALMIVALAQPIISNLLKIYWAKKL